MTLHHYRKRDFPSQRKSLISKTRQTFITALLGQTQGNNCFRGEKVQRIMMSATTGTGFDLICFLFPKMTKTVVSWGSWYARVLTAFSLYSASLNSCMKPPSQTAWSRTTCTWRRGQTCLRPTTSWVRSVLDRQPGGIDLFKADHQLGQTCSGPTANWVRPVLDRPPAGLDLFQIDRQLDQTCFIPTARWVRLFLGRPPAGLKVTPFEWIALVALVVHCQKSNVMSRGNRYTVGTTRISS